MEQPQTGGVVAPLAVPARGRRPQSRRVRLLLAMSLGIMALLCVGGVGVVVSVYDKATEIKRSAPDAVADQFLRAYLVDGDDTEVGLFTCRSGGNLTKLRAFRDDIQSRERRYSIGIRVSWTSLTVATSGGQSTVTTDIVRTISDGSERTADKWQFVLVDQDGWRVCGANPLS
jgi:hypothetical protein